MNLTEPGKEQLEQLAKYLAHGISAAQAGAAIGYSESRVLTLCSTESFQEILRAQQEEIVSNYVDTNSMYDRIEKKALENIEKVMRFNSDPDFNMRVAMLANRATRRGQSGLQDNQPLNAAAVDGRRITLNLSQQFVQIVQGGAMRKTEDVEVHRAELDVASPNEVTNLLGVRSFKEAQVEGISPMSELRKLADFLD